MKIRDVRRILESKQSMSDTSSRLTSPNLCGGRMGRSDQIVVSLVN